MEQMEEPIARPASTPGRMSLKSGRSFSDPPNAALAPSPEFKTERSRDDHDAKQSPSKPRPIRRPDFHSRGLTLQLPPPPLRSSSTETTSIPPPFAVPLSPKLDSHNIYMQSPSLSHSPATSLPRHSRGLDFSRACTNLHHTTLADQSDPDSSPVIGHRALHIPGRKMSVGSMALDSPNLMGGTANMPWGLLGQERSTLSSSVGSVNMMASESDTSESDEDASMAGDDNDDPIYATPQVRKLQNPNAPTPFNAPVTPSTSSAWLNGNNFSPAQASLMKTIRRTRLHKSNKKSRKSSSSASNSGYSSMASPRTTSPPPLRSIETATGGGYFAWSTTARSRRESLAMGTDGLNLSSGNDSGDEGSLTAPSTPGVVRRPVTRRGNLLPKTKGFARIRAALAEEAAPVDTEVRREAETIKQVRERDGSYGDLDLPSDRAQSGTAASSPNLLPAVPESAQEDFGRDFNVDHRGLGMNFAEHASRNSGGMEYWNRFDPSLRTPPPPVFARQSSSAASDFNMDSPMGDFTQWRRPRGRSSASDASEAFQSNGNSTGAVPSGVSDDMHLKKFKRRREEDFDIATIKRRAVSPGMSAQNSPVLTNSPSARDLNGWGQPPDRRDKKDPVSDSSQPNSQSQGQLPGLRSGNGASSIGGGSGSTFGLGNLVSHGKKLGLQPMADTNQGLMNMTIE